MPLPGVRLGILRETRTPPDRRVPLTPADCSAILQKYPEKVEILVQPSRYRVFSAQEYVSAGARIREDLIHCDFLLGVKEVDVSTLLYHKTYLFFAHVAKMQAHNRELLRHLLLKKITLIDYEYLTWDDGRRILGFGRFAGLVGAHNALWAWGQRTGAYRIPRAYELGRLELLQDLYQRQVQIPPVKVVVTGRGRSASGAIELLRWAGFHQVDPQVFLEIHEPEYPVFVQLTKAELFLHREKKSYDRTHFHNHPEEYESAFRPYLAGADVLINCLAWDYRMPRLFTPEELRSVDPLRLRVISDVSCDLNGSVPITVRITTIENPVYGYDLQRGVPSDPFHPERVDVIAIDHLPNELPADASAEFSRDLKEHIIPLLVEEPDHPILQRATIVKAGKLTERFAYLESFVSGKPEP